MSTLLRSILILALTVTSGSAARADPPAVSARYSTNWPAIVAGDPITLQEFGLSPAGAPVTRRIDWGDGSPVQVETVGDRWEHRYAAAGTFGVSVALGGGSGTFPYGDTVTVYESVPPSMLSADYRLTPSGVRAGEPVTMTESDVRAGNGLGAYLFRTVDWGDGTTQDFNPAVPLRPHRYRAAGTYRVAVKMENLQWRAAGTFPGGSLVTVAAAGSSRAGAATDDRLPAAWPVLRAGGAALVLAGSLTFVLLRRRRVRLAALDDRPEPS